MENGSIRNRICSELTDVLFGDAFLTKNGDYGNPRDKAFAERLKRGVTERYFTLFPVLTKLLKEKPEKLRPALKTLLLMGLYEVLYMQTASYAVTNEYVALSEKRGFGNLKGVVNGVLRNAIREGDALLSGLRKSEEIAFSPEIWKLMKTTLEPDEIMTVGRYYLSDASKELTIRRNESRCTDAELREALQKDGAEISGFHAAISEDCIADEAASGSDHRNAAIYRLHTEKPMESLKAFQDGWFYVEDASPATAVHTLRDLFETAKNEGRALRILDMAASPGGKTFQVADLAASMQVPASITSCDVTEKKLIKLSENRDRMGFRNVNLEVSDGTVHRKEFEKQFDLVIADVPCSGLGVFSGKPDIKLHVTESAVFGLLPIQKAILENAGSYVRTGGTLFYSTCTLTSYENGEMTRTFLENHPEFKSVSEHTFIPGVNARGDGFYYHRMERIDD